MAAELFALRAFGSPMTAAGGRKTAVASTLVPSHVDYTIL